MDLEQEILHDPVLQLKYDFIQKIGEGCFGKIYQVKNRQLKIVTALKLQIIDGNSRKSMLQNEADILKSLKGKPFVPQFYSHGTWSLGAYIEIQLLVSDLSSLAQKIFSFDEICSLTAKLFHSLSVLHNTHIVHQDIKPQNIMINKKGEYVFIDFGISKKMQEIMTGLQPQARKTKGFIGTPRYASIRAHRGIEQSKKDDLQSLMYNIAFLYFKKLPWLSLKVAGNRKIEEIKNTKLKTADVVFQQMGKNFSLAFNYVKKLEFNEQPNYKYIISIFKRTHSMIQDPNDKAESGTRLSFIEKAQIRRKQAKKLTLNPNEDYGKYLQLPFLTKDGITQRKSKKSKQPDQREHRNSLVTMGNNSMNGSKAISMNAYFELDEIQKDENLPQSRDMNLKEEQNQQPCVGNISKFFGALTMKNPFSVHNS